MPPTHTGRGVDLAGVAAAAGFRHAETLRVRDDLQAWIPRAYADPGPLLAVAKVSANPAPLVVPPRDGAYLKHRFLAHLLGERSAG